jgi:SAM-dependent methyltransferase
MPRRTSRSVRSALSKVAQRLRPRSSTDRQRAELAAFAGCTNVHDLPPIYNYWCERHLHPAFRACGFTGVDEFFVEQLAGACRASTGDRPRIASIGAGNCDLEVRLAGRLRSAGLQFEFECIEINADMLARGQQAASAAGVADHLVFRQQDAAEWRPSAPYAACLANHSLHHIVELERVFGAVQAAIHPDGVFVTADMIGRNGHRCWPEALRIVRRLWRELPDRCKYHHQLRALHRRFVNWDCAAASNEGIRAQDILPLLLQRFHFEVFCAFANVISVFVDRGYGHNFDVDDPHDRAFIDRVAALDDRAIDDGRLKPTQMVAALRTRPVPAPRWYRQRSPERSIRRPHWWQ